ncbi:MAG: cell division protein ZapA [Maricaulaceae bacterium]
MAKVSLRINGKQYALGCDDGEEERLTLLGNMLNTRVTQLADQFGQIGDLRLMVMAGITMLDEMEDLKVDHDANVSEETLKIERDSQAILELAQANEQTAVKELDSVAATLEGLTARLKP